VRILQERVAQERCGVVAANGRGFVACAAPGGAGLSLDVGEGGLRGFAVCERLRPLRDERWCAFFGGITIMERKQLFYAGKKANPLCRGS
jgi:hypothetical protein